MKTILFAAALLAGTSAIAQTETIMTTDPEAAPVATTTTLPSTGSIQAPSNANPEHDARGIAVISDPAYVPAGYNGTAATGVGGPLVDSADAAATTDTSHPPCTHEITDNCLQTYERGRSPQ